MTPGSALVTQAIQFIRERTSVIYRAASDGSTVPNPETALRPLVVADLPLRVLQVDRLRPDFVARAQVLVTLLSDDRRSFLHEVTIPLEIPAQRRARALELQAATVVVARPAHVASARIASGHRDHRPGRGRCRGEAEDPGAGGRHRGDAAGRFSATLSPGSRCASTDLALRVELDVAILELAVLERVQYRAAVAEPRGTRELTFTIEVYADEDFSALSSLPRREPAPRLCASALTCTWSVPCVASAALNAVPGDVDSIPLSPCSDPTCHGSFCDACSEQLRPVRQRQRALSTAPIALGCGKTACTTCLAECAFEPGLPMHSDHVQKCRDCGRLACPGHGGRCGLEGPGAPRLCADDLKVCEIGGHGIAVCASHRVTCAGCGKTACHQHAGSCAESTCNDAFCDACSERCGQCGKRACHQHRADCAMGCGRTACTSCQAECALEPGQRMHSGHLKSCRECGRLACPRHTGECGDEAPGTAVVCVDDLRACAVGDHGLAVCVTHSVDVRRLRKECLQAAREPVRVLRASRLHRRRRTMHRRA